MNRRSLTGLILFAVLVTASLFAGASYLAGISNGYSGVPADVSETDLYTDDEDLAEELIDNPTGAVGENQISDGNLTEDKSVENSSDTDLDKSDSYIDLVTEEPWLSANPTDKGSYIVGDLEPAVTDVELAEDESGDAQETTSDQPVYPAPELIYDHTKVDYMSYIPEMVIDSELQEALNIDNPDINLDAKAAVLIDADTGEILYYKNPVITMFPASTAKLLTSLVALMWCELDEQVTIGDEISMIASDSTKAGLRKGQVLTVHNLLEGMLLPSGNDAAYAIAAYVGRKSLDYPDASKEEAIDEFVRLMNKEAKNLGVKNSCFKTPDGYDAIGQYTTAYDMALIGVAAANNPTIVEISSKRKSSNKYVSGEQVTWTNTNRLINRDYGDLYYSNAIGLKTGTTSLAGRNIVAAARSNGRTVVCAVMDSSVEGRWKDAIKLLKYGLK